MSFLYSAIGDNTPENREWLEKVGYKDISRHSTGKYIKTTNSGGYSIFSNDLVLSTSSKNYTNNPQLFRAVTAMRDDSDYMQLFKCDGGYFISSYNDANTHIQDYCKGWDMSNLKKMSLSELQEHFQRV